MGWNPKSEAASRSLQDASAQELQKQRLNERLRQAEMIIEVPKKVSEILGITLRLG